MDFLPVSRYDEKVSIYRYSPGFPIQEITFRYANDRPPWALISAPAQADAGPLRSIRKALEAEGWHCVPVSEGAAALQVSGFKDEGQLAALLAARRFVGGAPRIQAEPGDHPTRSWQEWLEDTSLKACGWGNVIGDMSLLASGLMSGRGAEALSGLLYTAGGATLARFGNVKTEEHLREVSERTAAFLQRQAGQLPEECGLFQILKERRDGALPDLERFLTRYPSQTTVGIYTLGAAAMLHSGIRHKKPWDIAYGANSTLAGAASILIPEKKFDAAHPKRTGIAGVFDWMQEKPLRAAGYAYVVSDIALGLSAYREYKASPQQRAYIFKFISAGTYIVSSVLMAISNKNHTHADGGFDAEEKRRIEALAAEAILSQPPALRADLVRHVAIFLSTQAEMRGSAAEIGDSIAMQVAQMEKNPWSYHVKQAPTSAELAAR